MQLAISTSERDGRYLVQVMGEVDVSCADDLRKATAAALETQPLDVEVDLSEVEYIDSTGIGVLVGAAHHAREQERTLIVSHPQPNVLRVLALLGVAGELGIGEIGE